MVGCMEILGVDIGVYYLGAIRIVLSRAFYL